MLQKVITIQEARHGLLLRWPAKYEVKSSWFWNRVYEYWICFVVMHLVWILVLWSVSYSPAVKCPQLSYSHCYSIPGVWHHFLLECMLFWKLETQPPQVVAPCWPKQCFLASGNQTSLGSIVQMWETGGKLLSLNSASLTHRTHPHCRRRHSFSHLSSICSLQAVSSILKAPFRWNNPLKHVTETW